MTKRGERFASSRCDWTTHENIANAYDAIYYEMVEAGVAIKLDVPVYSDREGNPCEEHEAYGLPQDIMITHPESIIFADEVGGQCNQKKDNHVGGELFLCQKGTVPQLFSSTRDFFTSASGEAIACVVIFKSERANEKKTDCDEIEQNGDSFWKGVRADWKLGIDHTVDPVKDENGNIIFEANIGPGKYFPGGPTCTYHGKTVPCLAYASDSGGITAGILVEILKEFNDLELLPRAHGELMQFLLIDGHQSRLDPSFLSYINDENHRWKVCLGVPYATSLCLWQVADSSEHNGKFKSFWVKYKRKMIEFKCNKESLPNTIEPTDVMPAASKLFPEVYNHKEDSRKAISDRGWYPPNRKLLQHPSLKKPEEVATDSMPALPPVNIDHGMSASCADRLIQARQRSDAGKRAADKRKRDDVAIGENLRQSKKLTAGVLVGYGVHALDHPDFIATVKERAAQKEQQASKKKSKDRAKLVKMVKAVQKMRSNIGHESDHLFVNCNFDECGAYLQYKKKAKGDPAMPKSVEARRQRCREWIPRPSPHFTPHASDDEADEMDDDDAVMQASTEDAAEDDAVLGLLEMASNRLSEPEADADEDHDESDDDGYGMDFGEMGIPAAAA